MIKIKKYFMVWLILAKASATTTFSTPIDTVSYTLGKLSRFVFGWIVIFSIFRFTDALVGYTQEEVLLFFVTYYVLDVLAQVFLRGLYHFSWDVQRGQFDFHLTKPISPLFQVLFKITDVLDFIFLIPILGLFGYVLFLVAGSVSVGGWWLYAAYMLLGFFIAVAFHVLAAAFALWSQKGDSIIFLYRYLVTAGRFPPEVLPQSFQFILTFAVPVIVMTAFPVKVLLGQLSLEWMLGGALIALSFWVVALLLWQASLKRYSSASS